MGQEGAESEEGGPGAGRVEGVLDLEMQGLLSVLGSFDARVCEFPGQPISGFRFLSQRENCVRYRWAYYSG